MPGELRSDVSGHPALPDPIPLRRLVIHHDDGPVQQNLVEGMDHITPELFV